MNFLTNILWGIIEPLGFITAHNTLFLRQISRMLSVFCIFVKTNVEHSKMIELKIYYQISELDSSNICLRYSRGCWGHTIYLSIIQMAGLDNLMKNCKIIFHQNNNHSSPSTKAKGKIAVVARPAQRFSTFSNLCIVVTCTAVLIIPRVIILTSPPQMGH